MDIIKLAGILFRVAGLFVLTIMVLPSGAMAQTQNSDDSEFGPIVRAYLKYLATEQNVVDDRVSRHEVTPEYYRRNSNRIHALRAMAVRIARETNNDYLPELEAAAQGELHTLFEHPPEVRTFKTGEVVNNTFRFLGIVRTGEVFYLFARLDPYEQADLVKKETDRQRSGNASAGAGPDNTAPASGRPRRTKTP